jgi:serpin B
MNALGCLSTLTTLSLFLSSCAAQPKSQIAQSNQSRAAAPDVQTGDVTALVDGNNTFALDLYRALRDNDGNLIFSPFSVSLAVAMTYAGARAETETQMANALHFDLPQDRLHPAFNALELNLIQSAETQTEDRKPLQLNIANAVWAEQSYPFLPAFLDSLALNYGAGVRLADFINAAESARREINTWVGDQTNDKIKDLIPEGVITHFTRMVLVNAIYFKADWLDPFDPDSTVDMPFHLLDGSEVSAPTMNQGMHIPYARGDGWQAIELTYAGESAAMDVIVPDEGRFEQFESNLDGETVSVILAGLQPAAVQLALPKFEFTTQFGLVEPLKTLGMTDAFDPERADFTGMTDRRELVISDIVHQAFVAVDEEGTEAAAATAVIVGVTSAPLFDITLTIDRPFMFMIRDLESGQILFIGRVLDPAQS